MMLFIAISEIRVLPVAAALMPFILPTSIQADDELPVEATSALDRAVRFYAAECGKHGGYVWRYSNDLALSEGEAETDAEMIWVQPPGTPTVGEAFLDAYEVTGKADYLGFAMDAGQALVAGRRHSGGWSYSIDFDPEVMSTHGYVSNEKYRQTNSGRRDKRNVTTLDDDTTTAAIRFLVRLDGALEGRQRSITDAARAALDTLVIAQRANGGWPQNWSAYPEADHSEPAPSASIPATWSQKWLNDWPGQYYLNDDVAGQTIRTLLDGYDHFRDERYLAAALRGGEFLQSARLPEPQPAWAQQYDAQMHPCWDRKFEPPAISGHESEDAMLILIELAERTGEDRFLDGLERSIEYLRSLELSPGRLARFYELRTNKPLYFTTDYQLTYDDSDVPSHYGFAFDARADAIERKLKRVRAGRALVGPRPSDDEVAGIIAALDDRGAWVDDRTMRGFRKASPEGVISPTHSRLVFAR